MKVICVSNTHLRTLRIKLGEWIDVTTKSRNDYSEDSKSWIKTRYFFVKEGTEYALDRKYFLTIEEWRDKQLNQLLYDNRCDNNNDDNSLYD